MSRYLIVTSRDLHEYASSSYILELAGSLKNRGHEVTLYLVENGVLAARKGAQLAARLNELSRAGVTVLAEDVSAKARGIEQLAEGVRLSNMDELADLVVDGCDKVIWY
jgi:sulfur relay protein TusB/DsrH